MSYRKPPETNEQDKYHKKAQEVLRRGYDMLEKRDNEIDFTDFLVDSDNDTNATTSQPSGSRPSRWQRAMEDAVFYKDPVKAAMAFKEGLSNLKIPYTYAHIRGKTAAEVDTMPFPRVVGTEYRDMNTAFLFQKLMDYAINNVLDFEKVITELYMKQKNVFGDGFLRFGYKKMWETYRKVVKKKGVAVVDKDGEIKYKKYDVMTFDDIYVDIVPIENLVFDTSIFQSGKTIRDAKRMGIFHYIHKDDFESVFSEKEGFFNHGLVMAGGTMNTVPEYARESRNTTGNDFIEIYEGWDLIEDCWMFIANGVTIFYDSCPYWNKFTKKKYLPIAHFVDNISPYGAYNFGEPDMLHDIDEERHTQKNINLDVSKHTGGMVFVDEMADFDIDDVEWRHGGFVRMSDPNNSVREVNLNANVQLPFSNMASLADDSTVVSGFDAGALLGGAGESATATLEKKESGMLITRFVNKYNEKNGFKDSYTIIKNLMLQFYKKDRFKNIMGNEGETLYELVDGNSKVFRQDYDLLVVSNNQIPATREIRKLRNQEILGIVASMPVDQDGKILPHMVPVYKQVLLDMGMSDVDVEEVLGIEGGLFNMDGGEAEDAELMAMAESLGADVSGLGGNEERSITRGGSVKKSVNNPAASDMQRTVQNLNKF